MHTSRLAIAFSFIVFFVSCSNNKSAEVKPVINRDTPVVHREPVNPFSPVDISPMDMSYYPADFPVKKMTGEAARFPVMRVIYSRPHRQGRKIFGSLLKYGEPWRLGANEATEIEFFQPVRINKKNVSPGRYIMYCIPYQDKWTVILNANIYTWGLQINKNKDLQSFEIPVTHSATAIEYFTMVFEQTSNGADLIMTWDDVIAKLPIVFSAS